jgi:group I intron endonuclease
MGVIYVITNTVNQKRYVGKTVCSPTKRWREHRHASKSRDSLLYRSMRKHGIANFSLEVVDHALLQEELNAKEAEWIARLNTTDCAVGYNSTTGGDGGMHAPHSRSLLKGVIKRSEEYKVRLRARIISPETRVLMAEAARKREALKTPEHRTAQARRAAAVFAERARGVRRPREVVEKIAAANRGKKRDPELVERWRAKVTGRKCSPEEIANRSASLKATWGKKSPEELAAHGAAISASAALKRENEGEFAKIVRQVKRQRVLRRFAGRPTCVVQLLEVA